MKRMLSFILSCVMIMGIIASTPIISYAVTTPRDVFPETVYDKIYELNDIFGGTYFNIGQNTECGAKASGHSCSKCKLSNIIAQSWFVEKFGSLSVSQFPKTYYSDGSAHGPDGWSCFSFATFAEWYLFSSRVTDKVTTNYIGTFSYDYQNVSRNVQIGDIIRLGSGHSAIVISYNTTGVQVLDSNWGGSYNCRVGINTIKYEKYSDFAISRAQNASGERLFSFELNEDGQSYSLVECRKTVTGAITIPSEYDNKPVRSIGYRAFWDCDFSSVVIPDTVTLIDGGAFYNCKNLTSVVLPVGITSIPYDMFWCCEKLKSVTIPDGVTSIGREAFIGCSSLESIVLPDSLISISDNAFYMCSKLKKINIPASVTDIGYHVFYDCGQLESIDVDKANLHFCSENGVLFNKQKTKLIDCPDGIGFADYSIPETVTDLNCCSFSYCKNLKSVIVPASVTYIKENTFSGCENLSTVTIPVTMKSIDYGAFESCRSLKKVNYSGELKQWEDIDIGGGNGCLTEAFYSRFVKPDTPVLKSVSNVTDGVKVTWNSADGAYDYIVYRKTAKSGWSNLGTVEETAFLDKSAKSGTTYYYTVRGRNDVGLSGFLKTGIAIKRLSNPKLSKVYNNGNGNVVSWGKVAGASGYYVYRKTSSGWSKIATIKKGSATSYTDKKVTYGKTYIYTVRAYSGKALSSFNGNGITILKKLPNVSISTKNINGGKRVYLSSSVGGAAIYYKTSSKGSYKKYIGDFGLTSTKTVYAYAVRTGYYKSSTASKKLTVTKVKTPVVSVKDCVGGKKISFTCGTSGATIYYKTSKNGSYVKYTAPFTLSSSKTIYVKACKPGYATSSTANKKVSVSKVAAPTGLTVKSYNSTSAKISWKKVAGAQGYFIYRANEKNGTYTLTHTVKGGSTISIIDTGLTPSTTYYYKVRAYCNGKASSNYTSTIGVTTKAIAVQADNIKQ